MQKANYTSTTTASGGQGKYPLSTQTLDFIQQQVMILQLLGYIGGSKYILRQPDGTNTGWRLSTAKSSRWRRNPYRRPISGM